MTTLSKLSSPSVAVKASRSSEVTSPEAAPAAPVAARAEGRRPVDGFDPAPARSNFKVADFPANLDLPNVLTVASMDKRNDKLASYSSHGDKVVELAAVGEDVLSTVPGNRWEEMSGTSMATPRVAATAALMFTENPDLTAAQVRDLLVKTVELDPDLKGKVSTSGKLDLDAAVAAARASAARAAA